jgi:hypothetical protein
MLPPGRLRLAHQARSDRVNPDYEYDRDRGGRRLGRHRRRGAGRGDNGDLALNQIDRQRRKSVILAFRPPVLDDDVLALHEARFLQALSERGHQVRRVGGRLPMLDEPSMGRNRSVIMNRHTRTNGG